MGFQCTPQVKGLVWGDGARRDGKGQAKHRANAAAIINEAFEIADPNDGHPIPIRKSASETYDRSRTINNRYTGYRTADAVLEALETEAAKQTVEVRVKDKATGEIVTRKRALPSSAVIGVAVIYKPPCEIAKDWPREKYDRFVQDSKEVMESLACGKMDKKGEIIGEKFYLFRQENIIATAEHQDEGARSCPDVFGLHEHDIYIPKDQHGKYNGNLIDALFLSAVVNRHYPRLMRERGWDIDDCDTTDWEQFTMDKEYRARRKAKIRKGGKSVNNYVADKKKTDAEAVYAEAQEILEQTETLRQEAVLQAEAIHAEAEKLNREKQQAEADRDRAKKEAADAQQQRMYAQMAIPVLDGVRTNMQSEIKALEQAHNKACEDRDAAKAEAEAAKADRDAARKEADELRRNAVAQAEQAARETQARFEADSRAAWQRWLDNKKKRANDVENKIIREAKAKAAEMIAVAAEAAEGEYAFLLKWLDDPRQRYKTGETFLEVARKAHAVEIRKKRVSALPPEIRDAGKGRQMGQDGRDITDD